MAIVRVKEQVVPESPPIRWTPHPARVAYYWWCGLRRLRMQLISCRSDRDMDRIVNKERDALVDTFGVVPKSEDSRMAETAAILTEIINALDLDVTP